MDWMARNDSAHPGRSGSADHRVGAAAQVRRSPACHPIRRPAPRLRSWVLSIRRLTIYSYNRRYASRKVIGMQIDLNEMAVAADKASELLRSLGNRHRLLILCQLIEAERS